MLEDEDGMNVCSCLCSGCEPTVDWSRGQLRWSNWTWECTVSDGGLCASSAAGGLCASGSIRRQTGWRLQGIFSQGQRGSQRMALWCGPVVESSRNKGLLCRPTLSETGAVVCSPSEHNEVFNACVSVKRLWQINVLHSKSEILFRLRRSQQIWKMGKLNTDQKNGSLFRYVRGKSEPQNGF